MLLLLCTGISLRAQQGSYAITNIPTDLMTNANAVVRVQQMRFEILDTRRTLLRNYYVVSILNENGEGHSGFAEYYDKYRDIKSIEGNLYDAQGRLLRKLKKRELHDLSGVSGETLMDDSRIKQHNFYNRSYPYTVEYTVEIESKGTLFFPEWTPQPAERLAVQRSTMTMVYPRNYVLRYKGFNYDREPQAGEERMSTTLTWMVDRLPAIVREPYSPMWHELSTKVIFGPSAFQVEDYRGTMTTWKDFGKFVNTLKQGRSGLPASVKNDIHRIADVVPDQKEKLIRLYQYMQSQTRYVSIQLGIGSWQPYDATYVANRKYGDCKALVNYMFSILKEVNIDSYYALVRAGDDGYITPDFPSQQFNHV
ncbi:MAG: DUF3857 domain-containing protein, partial [Chitinophagaceae bacterium]|nr:DUF3857 domain-containing protein [Chitinophagaceae bacterium]